MGKRTTRWVLYAAVLFLVGCDHATKSAAQGALVSGRVITLIRGILELRYTENFDTAFSLTRDWGGPLKTTVLSAVAVATTAAVVGFAWWRRKTSSSIELTAFALIVAGAVGNTFDRLRRGYVVDFVHLSHWPVFNVADVLVVVGAILLAWASLAGPRSTRSSLSQ
jgi:signal peptidase II